MNTNQTDIEPEKTDNVAEAVKNQPESSGTVKVSDTKHELKLKVTNWWHQEKDKIAQGGMLKFLQENKDRFDKTLSSIHQNHFYFEFVFKAPGTFSYKKISSVGG